MMGLIMAANRSELRPGDLVMISISMDAQTNNPAVKFDGEVHAIRDKHFVNGSHIGQKPQFTLYGVTSEFGLPYWFLADDLIPM